MFFKKLYICTFYIFQIRAPFVMTLSQCKVGDKGTLFKNLRIRFTIFSVLLISIK